MRTLVGAIVIGLLVGSASSDPVQLSQQAQNTLTTIDSVPTREQLDAAFSGSTQTPLANLSALATDAGNGIGIRLRAIHALGKYCPAMPCVAGDTAHVSLQIVIDANRSATSGPNVLLLRAAIETLGAMRITDDASYLIGNNGLNPSLLDHPSRDVRASTAAALANICNTSVATNPLRVRYSHEQTEQVKLAISEALRILGQCSGN
jgi:hypothetical protein